jgi:hypothetical protein
MRGFEAGVGALVLVAARVMGVRMIRRWEKGVELD